MPSYTFSGDPVSIAAASKAHAADAAAQAQMWSAANNAAGQMGAAREQGQAMRDATLFEQPGKFAGVLGNLYGGYANAAPQMLGAYTQPYSNAFNGYMAGLGGLGNATGVMGAGAMQGLGATGQQLAANLGTIGAAQANSLAAQSNAAANAYGQLGVGNYNLQGQLGTAMAQAAVAQAAASQQQAKMAMLERVLPGLLSSPGGGGFNTSDPNGMIASGSYSGPRTGGRVGSGSAMSRQASQPSGFDALGNFINSQMDRMALPGSDNNRILDGLASQFNSNRDATLTSGREAIGAGSQILPQLGGQMSGAFKQGTDALQGLAGQMGAGFNRYATDTGNAYNTAQAGLTNQFDKAFGGVNDMWDKSLGKNEMFMTPAEKAKRQTELADYNRQREDELYASGNDPGSRRRLATQRAEEDRRLDYLQHNQISADRGARIQADTEARQSWWNSMTPRQRRLEGMKQNPFGSVGGWQNSLMRGQTW